MTTDIVAPPRAKLYDKLLLKLARKAQSWRKLSVLTAAVGVLECTLNIWQFIKQPDLKSRTTRRRQLWIDQAKAANAGKTRIALVTGGNTGLGYETAKALVEAGYLTIIACRSVGKGQEAVDRIEKSTGIKGMAIVMSLDLSSQENIKAFIRDFKDLNYPHLDVLVNNAGVMDIPFMLTKDGYEMQFGVNHLGHYVLTLGLLQQLNKAEQGRIVILTSGAMFSSSNIRYDRLQSSVGYSRLGHYSYSKLANMLFIKALDRRLREQAPSSKITINGCHPGTCHTELFRSSKYLGPIQAPLALVFRSPLFGAMSSIYLALAPPGHELESTSGEYFFDQAPREPNPAVNDLEQQDLLWQKSVEFTGVDFKL
ncbi:hypothetical protein BCR41DRAFT_372847 [Lobosporangium transversale]|uniref:NAD(P)-binding protein n=1 Tax=Lobosporangium transversale TaxID=64571 RepID=A0A1Y2GFF9_9FUNG|nr:hypothetical protein BCR41DRAFT_372847 [Lobosporangium transversale]ORZ09351.1 hypothetical protein BCR41DRAFT_372847 [Lobosporangium transversale]|eukprot:XP_021878804.1 hypothetical protein BCR41DRAFT_372847 [Lobosporangium transversale]